jgi:hypothetical protein
METVSRRLSWDNTSRPGSVEKDVLKSTLLGGIKTPTGHSLHFAKVEELKTLSRDLASSGKTTEEVGRKPVDQLLRGTPTPVASSTIHPQSVPTPDAVLRATIGNGVEGFIDPITNRRVSDFTPKYGELDQYGPVPDAKAPNVQNAEAQPQESSNYKSVEWNEPHGQQELSAEEASKNYEDLDKYTPSKIDDPNTPPELTSEELTKEYDDLDKYKPIDLVDADAERPLTPEEESKQYTDLNDYSQPKLDEPDTPRQLTPEEESKNYEDLHKYGAVAWNEPNGLPQTTAEEQSKNYEDLHMYGAVTWNEPDGLRRLTKEEESKTYQDLPSYGAVAWSEPDGLRQLTPEEESKQYDDLNTYAKPFVASDALLAAHEAAQQDATPRGNELPAKVDAPVHNAAAEYTDLNQYGPVRWNEPDGLRQPTPEELSKKYEDLHLYGGGLAWNEPNGTRVLTPEEQSKKYRDLRAYSQATASGPEIIPNRTHPEEASKVYEDLRSYVEYDNGDPAAPRLHPEESSKEYEDLHKYSKYPNSGPSVERIHPEEASKEYEDLSEYPVAGFEEAQLKGYTHPEELTKEYADLAQYQPQHFDSASQAYPAHPEEQTKVYEDLAKYQPRAFDSPDRPYPTHPEEATKSYADLYRYGPLQTKADGKPLDPSPFTGTKPYISKDRLQANGGYSSLPRCEDADQLSEDGPSSMDESFPKEPSGFEPALVRSLRPRRQPNLSEVERAKLMADPYSLAPQGLQTSYIEECGNQTTWPTFTRHFAAKAERGGEASGRPDSNGPSPGPSPGTTREPKTYGESGLFKILVFDQSTRSVSMAETRSSVLGSFEPVTPADVFVRLSTPTAFLPYLDPLTAHGFDIVSGSGDVLVFRKVRPAQPDADNFPLGPAARARINPVDMMGSPVAGNFASPTGFVNYDTLTSTAPSASPARKKTKRWSRLMLFSGLATCTVTTVVLADSLAGHESRKASRVSTKA